MDHEKVQKIKAYLATLKPTLGGKILFRFLPFRKKLVLQNMRLVFENRLSDVEIHKLALSFYSHIFSTLKESIMMRFMNVSQIKDKAIVIGEEHLAAAVQNKRGGLIITGHFGNWEFAPIAGIQNFKDFKKQVYFVRKPQAIKFLEKIFFKRYDKMGLGVIYKKNSLTEVYQKLEDNQMVVFVMDQHAKGKEGVLIDFFGKKTNTYRTVAMIARSLDSPVIPARSYRRPDGKHVLEFFKPLDWQFCDDSAEEIKVNTRNYNQALENMILDYPDQWLWMYNRWKKTSLET